MKSLGFALAVVLLAASPIVAQPISREEAERMIADLQASHIRANVPNETEFAGLLERDLNLYFAALGVANASTRSELLRQGPTQIGIAYPKFYLWVEVFSDRELVRSGAVRVAAVQTVRFEVTDFLSSSEINEAPARVASIFPAALVPAIRERARVGAPVN